VTHPVSGQVQCDHPHQDRHCERRKGLWTERRHNPYAWRCL